MAAQVLILIQTKLSWSQRQALRELAQDTWSREDFTLRYYPYSARAPGGVLRLTVRQGRARGLATALRRRLRDEFGEGVTLWTEYDKAH
ncbi:MAG TPA: hypothetical protein VHS99_02930 [Chloroflexota bacterium]|nr:hypothetical protein [Chloroflexota bacterium]